MPYLKEFYDTLYAEGRTTVSDTFIDKPALMKYLLMEVHEGKNILDWGCGAGDLIAWLAHGASHAVGYDFSDAAISLARKRHLPSVPSDNLRFMSGSQANLLPNDWDLITCIGTLEHLDDPAQQVKDFAEALEPGGLLVIQTPSWLNRRGDIYHTLRTAVGLKMTLTDRHFFQPDDVPRMAVNAGLKVERTIGSHYDLAAGVRMVRDIITRLDHIFMQTHGDVDIPGFATYFNKTPLFSQPLDVFDRIPDAEVEPYCCDVYPWNQTGAATTYFLRKP